MIKKMLTKLALGLATGVATLCAPHSADAQIFQGGVGVIGTSNAVVQVNGVTVTNFVFSSLPSRTLVIQNLNTNIPYNVAYGFTFAGNGATNLYIAGTNQYTFPASNGWVQGQTAIVSVPSAQFNIPLTPWGQINIPSGSNNIIFF